MQAVILAAGLGSRLGDLKHNKPKAFLEPLGLGKSLIERSIGILSECGIKDIIIGTGYQNIFFDELCERYPYISTMKNEKYESTGSSQTLEVLKSRIKEDFLLLESDLLYEKRAVESLLNDKRKDIILASGKTNSLDEVFLELDEKQKLAQLSKDPSRLKKIDAELVGISKISYESFLDFDFSLAKDYEYLLVGFDVLKIDKLIWCEIDCKEHLERAESFIIPKLDY